MISGFDSSVEFPNPALDWDEGLVAIGGNLDVGTLYHAYRKGIFPWPQEGLPLLWFCPDQRGILFFDDLKIPSRFRKILKDSEWTFTRNQAFREVIRACREQGRPGQSGTWILPEMEDAYWDFHRAGFAHSFEVWRGSALVGGLYGVQVDGAFSGESMFYREPNASKFALVKAVEVLKAEGHSWMDTQMVTPVVEAFGGKLISKKEYLKLLKQRASLVISK